jgi:coenzyme F420-reducing hydrogenase delta subunit/Pyruvate/2-oxoacid:ferredoxin oxidoreductase delta subunit/ferredoxin
MADFRIKIKSTGDTFDVFPDDSILSILLENGYFVENSCTSGLCGACRVPYLEGDPDHRDMILSDVEKKEFLTTCVSRCKSDEILLDLPPPDSNSPIIQKEKPFAFVDQDICVACLTCVRACTYGAANIDSDAIGVGGIVGAAFVDVGECSGCGLCAAACPTGAISMSQFSDRDVITSVGELFDPNRFSSTSSGGRSISEPWIITFCCPHTAPLVKTVADDSKSKSGIALDIIEMPCTGRIDNLHLMRTFEDGADGVIVSGCEPGRCFHSTGNLNAAKRTNRVRNWLSGVSLGADRVSMVHLPSHDGNKNFTEALNRMGETIHTLGPNPLRVPQEVRSLQNKDDDKTAQVSPEDAVLAELGLL